MLEYGMLSGMGAGLLAAAGGAFDSLVRAGSDLLELAFEHPVASLAIVLCVLALGLLRLKR